MHTHCIGDQYFRTLHLFLMMAVYVTTSATWHTVRQLWQSSSDAGNVLCGRLVSRNWHGIRFNIYGRRSTSARTMYAFWSIKMSLICVPLCTLNRMHSSYNTMSWSTKKNIQTSTETYIKTAPIESCSVKPCGTIIADLPSPKLLVIYEHYPICYPITRHKVHVHMYLYLWCSLVLHHHLYLLYYLILSVIHGTMNGSLHHYAAMITFLQKFSFIVICTDLIDNFS